MEFRFAPFKGFFLVLPFLILLGCAQQENETETLPQPLDAPSSVTGNGEEKAAISALMEKVDLSYEMFELDNGLRVILHTDRSKPVVFVGVWYLVGSKDEPVGKSGFAHLFEHLLFEETENRKGDFFDPLLEAGAVGLNGSTTQDRTNYFQTVPRNALDLALWLESDRMANILGGIDQATLDEQRSVVKNEKRQRESGPYGKVYERVLQGLYPAGHPYRHTVIGSMEDLDNATLDDVRDWFKKYNGASNAVLILSGDLDLETAKEKVETYFGNAPAGEPLPRMTQWIPTLPANKIDTMQDRAPQTLLLRVWPAPQWSEKDAVLSDLVVSSLTAKKSSPLRKILVDEKKLATSVDAFVSPGLLTSTVWVQVSLTDDADVNVVKEILDTEIAKFAETGPTEELLEGVRLASTVEYLKSLEDPVDVGFELISGYLYAEDPSFEVETAFNWFLDATPEALAGVASRWLTKPYYELTVEPFGDYKASGAEPDRSQMPEIIDAPFTVKFPEIQSRKLDNGAELIFAKQPGAPVLEVSLSFATGVYADAPGALGATKFAFDMLKDGTASYSAEALEAALDKLAVSLAFAQSGDRSEISYSVLSPMFRDAAALVGEMLKNPTFPADEFEKKKVKMNEALEHAISDPSSYATAYFRRAIYGQGSPAAQIMDLDDLETLTLDTVKDAYAREFGPENLKIFIVGDADVDEVAQALNVELGDWVPAPASTLKPIGAANPNRARIVLVDRPGAQQSAIRVGHAIAPFNAETDTTFKMVDHVFGGSFTSRVNMNIREDKGWSYGVRSVISRNISGDQSYYVSGSVQTDKTAESMVEIKKEFAELISSRPITDEELTTFKRKETRSIPALYRTSSSYMGRIKGAHKFGLPLDYAASEAQRISDVTTDASNQMAVDVLEPDQLTWVVVGDLEKIEQSVRDLGYGDVEIWNVWGDTLPISE